MYVGKKLFLCVLITIIGIGGYASAKTLSSSKFESAEQVIEKLSQSILEVKKQSKLVVLFPAQVPQEKNAKLFASYSSVYNKPDYNHYWLITVGTTPNCQTRDCFVGSMSAEKDGKLDMNYIQAPFSPNTKPTAKQKVKLTQNIIGYYTPGHVEADWHEPTVEWKIKNVLYVLTWKIEGESKQTLIEMADSAFQFQQGQ
ncbi:MAG: hypothetical protein KIT56_10270 [Gammaproteobacteria bacterium]|nr:hypothetical protein [Gammaproteobacteria bacterium]MCW5584234.1 hypothetical protein [Gammaproteobacteria bacterium]